MRQIICAAIIKNGRFLLVKKEETWLLPGGKWQRGESYVDCLFRELGEEVPHLKLKIKTLKSLIKKVQGTASRSKYDLDANVYLVKATGRIAINKKSEICDSKWFKDLRGCKTTSVVKKVVRLLREKGYL